MENTQIKKITMEDIHELREFRKFYDISLNEYAKENKIDMNTSFKSMGFNRPIGTYQVKDFNTKNYQSNDPTYNTLPHLLGEFLMAEVVKEFGVNAVWSKLVARKIKVTDLDTRIPYVEKGFVDENGNAIDVPAFVAEGQPIPTAYINFKDKLVTVSKKGTGLKMTYEMFSRLRLDVAAMHMKLVAEAIDEMRDVEVIKVLKHGNLGKPAVYDAQGALVSAEVTGADSAPVDNYAVEGFDGSAAGLTYVNIKHSIRNMESDSKKAVFILGNQNTIEKIENLDEYKNNPFIFDAVKTGNKPTVAGGQLLVSKAMADNELILVDPASALLHLEEKGLLIEGDKLIDVQVQREFASLIDGFASYHKNARRVVKF